MQDFTFRSVFCDSNSTENTIIEILEYLEVQQFWQDFAKIFCMYVMIYISICICISPCWIICRVTYQTRVHLHPLIRSNTEIYMYIANNSLPISLNVYCALRACPTNASSPWLQTKPKTAYSTNKKLMLYLWKQCCHFFHCLIDFVSTMSKAIYRKERWWSYIDVTITVKNCLKNIYRYRWITCTYTLYKAF